MQVRIALNT